MEEKKKESKIKKKVIIGILGAGAGVASCCLLYHFVKNRKKDTLKNSTDYLLGQIFDQTSDRDYEIHPIFDAKDCRAIDNHVFTELAPNLERALLETNNPITVDETYHFIDGVVKKLSINIEKIEG